jgi:Protein tyrosine/serine phosphatase
VVISNIYIRQSRRWTSTFLLAMLLLLITAASPARAEDKPRDSRWAQPVALPQADNFYRVTPNLYRAAQPDAQAFREYESFGIKTVINLRANHSDKKKLAQTGLKLIEVPIDTWSLDDGEVIAVLRHIRNEPGPILVHCQHGADRTGTIMAMYRIIFQGWSREEALDEMINGGYGYHSIWTNLPKYIRGADLNRIRAVLGCPPSGACAPQAKVKPK